MLWQRFFLKQSRSNFYNLWGKLSIEVRVEVEIECFCDIKGII